MSHGLLGGDALYSPRVAPAIYGLGLLEAIEESAIESQVDPEDINGDGISGRVNRVWDPVAKQRALGRFGWKANVASLYQQVASAAFGDIGITTSVIPTQNRRPAQAACLSTSQDGSWLYWMSYSQF